MADSDNEPEAVSDAEAESEAEATTADAPAPTDASSSTDALLSVFQTTQAEAEDITLLLDLAGIVEIDDLLEELHTVAAALGIDTSSTASYDDDAMLAA